MSDILTWLDERNLLGAGYFLAGITIIAAALWLAENFKRKD